MSYHQLPAVAKCYHDLPNVAISCRKLPPATTRYQNL